MACPLCRRPGHVRKTCTNLDAVVLLVDAALDVLRRRLEGGGAVASFLEQGCAVARGMAEIERRATGTTSETTRGRAPTVSAEHAGTGGTGEEP